VSIGGKHNAANGNWSIAMGRKAKANHNRSCVINVALGDRKETSKSHGEFRVQAKQITFAIGDDQATINKDNVSAFASLLKNATTIEKLQKQVEQQEKDLKTMQRQIEKLMKN